MKCEWVVREGTEDTYWAYTPCEPGYNYLSKVHKAVDIPEAYEGRICPICGKLIHLNMNLLNSEIKESEGVNGKGMSYTITIINSKAIRS